MEISDILFWSIAVFAGLMLIFPVLMTIWAKVKGTKLEIPAKIVFGIPYWLINWTFNWTVMTVVFWPDFPEKYYEVTSVRMKRYRRTRTGRRLTFANFVCNWLNKFDPGHC